MKNVGIISILILSLSISGCGGLRGFVVADNTPANEIFAEANKEIARGKGTRAGDYLLEVDRLYPYTPDAERALILAAKAYHSDSALAEARLASERYLQFFPGGKDAALAQYLYALSYYDGIVDIDRDQSRTFEALKALQTVIDKFPNSEYAALSQPKFEIALNQLAGKEMAVGRYYLAKNDFTAAIARFKAVISEYPENQHKPEAMHRQVESYLKLGLSSEARAVATQLTNTYPNSEWANYSRSLLATGTQPNAGASYIRQILSGTWQ